MSNPLSFFVCAGRNLACALGLLALTALPAVHPVRAVTCLTPRASCTSFNPFSSGPFSSGYVTRCAPCAASTLITAVLGSLGCVETKKCQNSFLTQVGLEHSHYEALAGSALGQSEQWAKVANIVREAGNAAPTKLLEVGHDQLKTTLKDMLIWLNSSNVDL